MLIKKQNNSNKKRNKRFASEGIDLRHAVKYVPPSAKSTSPSYAWHMHVASEKKATTKIIIIIMMGNESAKAFAYRLYICRCAALHETSEC